MNPIKYPIIQSNGQRIYHPPSIPVAPPPRGSEVFVGNLPRDLFEDELIPLFARVGPIYRFRLMMEFSGTTRGFAFVCYYSIKDANSAVLRFNNYLIKSRTRSAHMSVHVSVDNCRLFFGNVPRGESPEEIEADLIRIIDGVVKVMVYPEKMDPRLNRGFAFVEFETHALAAIARRRLLAGVIHLWGNSEGTGQRFYVDWAEPEPIVDPMVLKQVKILYIKNVPISWSSNYFKEFTLKVLKQIEIVRTYKKDNYAFVHFKTRIAAEMGFKILASVFPLLEFYDKHMEVEWARPSNYSKKQRANELPHTLCTSVPPRLRRLMKSRENNELPFPNNPKTSGSNSEGHPFNDNVETGFAIDQIMAAQFAGLSLYSNF